MILNSIFDTDVLKFGWGNAIKPVVGVPTHHTKNFPTHHTT